MFELFDGISIGRASDGLSWETARQNGRKKPNYRDRIQTAICLLTPIFTGVTIMISAYISPRMKVFISYIIDIDRGGIFRNMVAVLCLVFIVIVSEIILLRLPFWLSAIVFTISTSSLIVIFSLAMQIV